jgi:hypothetical protein
MTEFMLARSQRPKLCSPLRNLAEIAVCCCVENTLSGWCAEIKSGGAAFLANRERGRGTLENGTPTWAGETRTGQIGSAQVPELHAHGAHWCSPTRKMHKADFSLTQVTFSRMKNFWYLSHAAKTLKCP